MANCSFLNATEARELARNNVLIWAEICAIQKAILAAIESNQYETIVVGTSPMTWVSGIESVTVTNGGSNYAFTTAEADIDHPVGTGAQVTPVVTNGTITGFVVDAAGSGYAPVVATINMSGSGNADATLTPIVGTGGEITDVVIVAPGTGYTIGDPVPVVFAGPAGSGFSAEVSLVGGSGEILEVTINDGGTGYTTVYATVTVTHPTGYGFTGTVQTSGGAVTGVTVTNGGVLYNTLYPTAVVSDTTGLGAVLSIGAADVVGGAITNINVENGGYGYSSTPTVAIYAAPTSAGSGATATASVAADPNNYSDTAPDYYDVISGQSSDRVLTDQIEFVTSYFEALGYTIRPQVNPVTGNTMQWYILW